MQKLYVDMLKRKFKHNPASNKFFANKRVMKRDERRKMLEQTLKQKNAVSSIPIHSSLDSEMLLKNSLVSTKRSSKIKKKSRILKSSVRRIVLLNNLASKHNKLRYNLNRRQKLFI